MPGGPRSANKDLAAVRLAAGGTVAESAAAAGVDPRTIFKWKSDDARFRARIAELRAGMVSAALGRLSDSMSAAADVLVALLGSDDEDVRHRAAVQVLTLALKVRSEVDVAERLAAVEALLKGQGNGAPVAVAARADRGGGGEEGGGAPG
jgi:hypothetical protein